MSYFVSSILYWIKFIYIKYKIDFLKNNVYSNYFFTIYYNNKINLVNILSKNKIVIIDEAYFIESPAFKEDSV